MKMHRLFKLRHRLRRILAQVQMHTQTQAHAQIRLVNPKCRMASQGIFRKSGFLGLIFFGMLTATNLSVADDGSKQSPLKILPKYQQECAACHIAYPPGMLAAAAWRRLMGNLPKHFGTDASLDAASVQQISLWLSSNAGTYGGTNQRTTDAASQDRISQTPWFIRQHDEIPVKTWKLASVKSPANCIACHSQANKGDFNEHTVHIPR